MVALTAVGGTGVCAAGPLGLSAGGGGSTGGRGGAEDRETGAGAFSVGRALPRRRGCGKRKGRRPPGALPIGLLAGAAITDMGIYERDYYRREGPSFLGSLVERGT